MSVATDWKIEIEQGQMRQKLYKFQMHQIIGIFVLMEIRKNLQKIHEWFSMLII